jgi:hypothetical protein
LRPAARKQDGGRSTTCLGPPVACRPMERLIRKLLRYPNKPAVILVHVTTWCAVHQLHPTLLRFTLSPRVSAGGPPRFGGTSGIPSPILMSQLSLTLTSMPCITACQVRSERTCGLHAYGQASEAVCPACPQCCHCAAVAGACSWPMSLQVLCMPQCHMRSSCITQPASACRLQYPPRLGFK